jgi:DNA-binding MurR/RpiR family transcriptional regulator
VALAQYLRDRAAAFSLSADVTTQQHVADAGMALLDAAAIAENLTRSDPTLTRLSEAGCYESMPDLEVRFVETEAVRAAIQRPLSGEPMTGRDIVTLIAAVANSDPGV